MGKKPQSTLGTGQIEAALRRRYSGNDWAFITEVPNGTGAAKSRSADAIAMSLWPSRGLELHGFEIKASRNDWLRELHNAAKAEKICRYCDRWWLAVGDPEIVKPDELPPTWGLLIPRGTELVQKVAAPKLTPIDVDRCFLAGMLRRASEQLSRKDEIKNLEYAARREGVESGREAAAHQVKRAEEKVKEIEQVIKTFQEKSGLSISTWNAGEIAAAVYLIRNYRPGQEEVILAKYRDLAQRFAAEIEHFQSIIDAIKATQPKLNPETKAS